MRTTAPEARVAVSWVNEISRWVMPRDRARGYRRSRATQERVAEIVQEHIDPIVRTIGVTIDRAFIAQSGMAEQVKVEIVELNENRSVLTLAEDVAGPLVIANNQIEAVLNADTSSAYQAVVDFDDLFSGKPGLRATANDPDDGAAPHIPRYTPWSQKVINFARQQFEASRR
jgi:hypothetical protein